jgi:hypothetical protein
MTAEFAYLSQLASHLVFIYTCYILNEEGKKEFVLRRAFSLFFLIVIYEKDVLP